MIEVFDNVNNNPIIANIQMQLSRIILHNLDITSAEQVSDEFLSSKADFILNDKNTRTVLETILSIFLTCLLWEIYLIRALNL